MNKILIMAAVAGMVLAGCGSNNAKKQETAKVQPEAAAPAAEVQPEADSVGYIVKLGDLAPDFSCKLADGKEFRLSEQKGKVVMLQFTASWCGVCRKEMPFIEKDIWQKYKDNEKFVLVGLDRDEPVETVLKFAEATGVTYPLGLDVNADIFSKYALRKAGVTRNVLIDEEGRIVKMTRLYNEEEFASLVAKIGEMLK